MAQNTLGRNIEFPILNADGTPFNDLVLKKSVVDSVVMSLGDKITGDVYYKDNTLAVTMQEYIEYKRNPNDENEDPVRYVLVTPPTIVREGMVSDNGQLKGTTKYSFTFYHPMYQLSNIPFTDVAVMSSQEKYLSQNKTFYWIGKIADFVAKINKNLQGTEWVVVLNSNNISTETLNTLSEVLSFDKNFVSDALKTAYDTWKIPFIIDSLHKGDYTYTDANNDVVDYYDEGKRFVVLFGLPSNEITNSAENFQVQTDDYLFGGIYMNTTAITLSTGDVITIGSDVSGFIVDSDRTILANKTYKATSSQNVYVARIGQGEINYTIGRVFVFRFGRGVGLKNNSRTPKNNKIVTRIIGFGSENNIPYGYPQIEWEGDSRWEYTKYENDDAQIGADGKPHGTPTVDAYPLYNGIVGGRYVKLIKHPFTRKNLMPSVYSDTVNKKVNPYATGYNPNIEIKDYYDAVYSQDYPYENEINNSAPSAHIQGFEDIKPELGNNVAILNTVPLDKNLEPTSSWDDSIDDNGDYNQSYFRITIPRLTFDLYACAAITQQMQINMRSGACLGCTFTVSVDWDDYKANFYDSDGNFAPSGQQRDTTKYPDSRYSSIYLIVQKDLDTFGTIMPNIYQQPQNGDTFVILGISLPTSYISAAEDRLDDAMKKYMLENNTYYYEYPLKFDEHFLATHTDILKQIRDNNIVRFLFANEEKSLYVKQITVKYGDKPLPQYDITLTEDVDITLNQIGQVEKGLHSLEKAVTNSVVSTSDVTSYFESYVNSNGNTGVRLKSQYLELLSRVLAVFEGGLRVGSGNMGMDANGNVTAGTLNAAGAATIGGNAAVGGDVSVSGDVSVDDLRATSNIFTNGYVQIGNARLVWDSTNNAIRVEGVSGTANLYATGGLACLGIGSGGGGGSVTSIGMSVPQGFTVSPSSISQSGTFAIGFANGYSLPSNNLQDSWTAKQDAISDLATIRQNAANGNTAYESLNGYALKSYLEGNWLVKSYESEDSQGHIINGDWIPGSIILEDGVLKTTYYQILIPTATSDLTNDSGFITSSALSGYATQSWVDSNYLRRTGGLVGGGLILYPSETGFVDSWRMTELDCANELTQEDYPYLPYDDRYLAYFNTYGVYPLYVGGGMVLQDLYTGDYGDITVNTLHVMNSARVANLNADLLDGYHASSFARASALNNYLPRTGGTLTGNLTIGNVTIYSTGSNGGINSILIGDDAYIGDGNMAGGIGIKAINSNVQAGIKFFTNEDKSCGELLARADKNLTYEGNLIWHAGNDGSGSGLDADTVDGYHAYQMMTKHAGENEYDNTAGLKIITVSNRTDIFDDNVPRYGSVLQWSNAFYQPSEVNSGNWYNQLFGINQDGGRLYYRNRENGGNWKTLHKIAYTTDNVASATKLATARSLWGQSFDGSGDVDGNLTFGSGYGINNLHTIYCANADLNHTLYLGYGGKDRVTWHEYGNDWQFWYGQGTGERTGGTLSVRLGATNYFEGNVGIGNLSPTYKLDVAGTLRATSNIFTNGYVQIGNARLVWDSTNNAIRVEGVSGTANLYATGGLACLGIGSGSSGSVTNLTVTDKLRIKAGSSSYHSIKNELINGNNYLRLSGDSGICLVNDTVIDGTLSVGGVGGLHVEDGVEAYGDITVGGDLTVGGDVKVDYNGDTYRLNVQAAINAGILTQVTA